MKPIKFIWTKQDTFDSIRKKLLTLKGKEVVNKLNEETTLTIFDVGEIHESEMHGLGTGFHKFLEGDMAFSDKSGGYNFEGQKIIPMWAFNVTYGWKDERGYTMSQDYSFSIPRTDNYEKDLKENPLTVDINHPFVYYELK